MSPAKIEQEDHARDAAFNKALHKNSAEAQGGLTALMQKNKTAQKAAVDEYFKHWDNKPAAGETAEDREVGPLSPRRTGSYTNESPSYELLNTLL